MISNGIPIPKIPEYQDSSPEAVRNLLIEEAQDLAEPFSHIAQNTDVRDSFKKLRATYAVTSHQHSFARYTKWTDLRFKNGTASEFVRKFQETLRDLTSIDGKINSVYVLCQFKKAINENPKCYAFLQNLRVDEKDVNLMDQVYAEFLEGANAIFAPASYPTVPQKGPPSGDPLARYNNLFTNVLFAGIQANAVHGSHIVSKEGLLANDNNDVTRWMIDSGTSTHMTPHRSVFVNFRRCVLPVSTATGDVFYTEGYGDVILHLLDQDSSGQMAPLTLQKVWLAPDLRSSLISMSALDKADIGTWTKNGMMTFKHQDFYGPESTMGFATCEGEHYWLNCAGIDKIDHMIDCNLVTGSPNSVFATQREIIPISIDLAHRRACHAGEERVRKMEIFADGVKLKKGAGVTFPCAPCIKGKGHALPFGEERSIRSKPGEFIHLDVWDRSLSRLTETQFNYVIKKVYGDDAPEHKPLAAYLASKGTVWDPTPPYTKQLNGVAEIKNRHLVEPLVAVMAEYQLPKYLWGLLLGGINYTMNRLYASKIGMSPYEALYGKKPNLSNLRALGCQCWFLIPKEKRNTKLDPHMEEARLLAYDEGDNYVVYNVRTKKIERSRNVIFNENPSPANLPDPAYDLNITGMNQEHEHDSQDRHIPIDFLRPHLENPFNIRSTSPPSPTVEDDPRIKRGLRMLSTRRIPRSLKKILRGQMMKWRAVLAGGRGVLVEPQPVSRQVVNMDIPLETTIDLSQENPLQDDEDHDQSPLQHDQVTFEHNFSRLDPVPDDRSRDQSYVQPIQPIQPETGQLRRSTRIKNPSRAYIESLASKSFFDSNVLRLLAEQPEILVSLFANATSNEQYATGFEPNSWEQAMSCVEKDKWLVAAHKELHHLVNGTWRVMSRTKSKKNLLPSDGCSKLSMTVPTRHGLLLVAFVKIPTADMAADGLTKPLGKTLFKRWIIQMGLTVYKNALNG
ncbi:hypothetical protein PDIDSM_5292 [Penicillium digitatum]|nr:hypothetical protein PDIDSM_5292 [Penicillium digitatum]